MKDFLKVVFFLGLVIVHIWLNRIESVVSYFLPIIGGFLFAYATTDVRNLKLPWTRPVAQEGAGPSLNPFKWVWVFMTIGLYAISFIDRG